MALSALHQSSLLTGYSPIAQQFSVSDESRDEQDQRKHHRAKVNTQRPHLGNAQTAIELTTTWMANNVM